MGKGKQFEKNHGKRWVEVIDSQGGLLSFRFDEIWKYRHLLQMFIKRDIASTYRQTILGPLWFLIQPLLTTITFTFIVGKFAALSSDGLHRTVFYLSGIILWNFFSESFQKISAVLKSNSGIFGKIYFPRLIMPLTIIASSFIRLMIQYVTFLIILIYFLMNDTPLIDPNGMILLTPLLILIIAGISLGAGMIFASLTIKYRDLVFLLAFGVNLLMFATPVIYPLSSIPKENLAIAQANPLSAVIEAFRYAYLGTGTFSWGALAYSFTFMIVMLLMGIFAFKKAEKTFIDSI
jgi:lipopolysaccharide transport system permease protein